MLINEKQKNINKELSIGNSKYSDDVWSFEDEEKNYYSKTKINFNNEISENNDFMKKIIYIKYKKGIKPKTLYGNYASMNTFLKKINKKIDEIRTEEFIDYINNCKKKEYIWIKNMIEYKSLINLNMDINEIIIMELMQEKNKKINTNNKNSQTKLIEDNIFKKIIEEIENNIELLFFKKEKNLKEIEELKYNILIYTLAFTGMRISELLSIKENCLIKEKIEEIIIFKVKSKTFKYKNTKKDGSYGLDETWIINEKNYNYIKKFEDKYKNSISNIKKHNFDLYFKNIKHKLNIDEKIGYHSFRRTLARFFAKSLLNMPVNILKEQLKHYSSEITNYYMKTDNNNDESFIEYMEEYLNEKDKETKKVLFEKIKNNVQESILYVKNAEDLYNIVGDRKLKIIKNYMISLEEKNIGLSPLECLSCEGVILIPNLHLNYWMDLEIMYKDLIEMEPNSFWYKKEYLMIQSVVKKLESGEAYIGGLK